MSPELAAMSRASERSQLKGERAARQKQVDTWFERPFAERGSLREEGDRSRCRVRAHARRLLVRFGAGGRPIYVTDNGLRGMAFVDGQPFAGDRSFGVAIAYFVRTGFLRVERGRFASEGKGSPSRRLYLAGELAAQRDREKCERDKRVREVFSRLRARDERQERYRLRGRGRRRAIAELARLGVPAEELRLLETAICPRPGPQAPPPKPLPQKPRAPAPPPAWELTSPPSEEQLAFSREARLKAMSELAHLFDPPTLLEPTRPANQTPVDAARLRLITDERNRQIALIEAWSRTESARRGASSTERGPPDGAG